MSAADAVRALADSGTPGLLRTSTWTAYDLPMLRSVTEDVWVGELRDAADAAKIVAAVNALPKVADLIDATSAHDDCTPAWCGDSRSDGCNIREARDALVEALGVSS